MRFQITLTSDHVADFGSVPFGELGDQKAKEEEEEEESVVKYKSANMYVGQPSKKAEGYTDTDTDTNMYASIGGRRVGSTDLCNLQSAIGFVAHRAK